jgi:hypothetical protein
MLGFNQFIDQPGRRSETDASFLPACRHAQSGE